jgi:hypothetical protein
MSNSKKLTPQELVLCESLLDGKTDLESYRLAYPDSTIDDSRAKYETKRICSRPRVKVFLDSARLEKIGDGEVSGEFVISRLKNIAQNGTGAAQVRSLELLGKTLGLFVDVVETNASDHATQADMVFKHRIASEGGENVLPFRFSNINMETEPDEGTVDDIQTI